MLAVASCSGKQLTIDLTASPLLRLAVQSLPNQPPHLELHHSFRRHVNSLQGLGIVCFSCRLLADFKDTKVTKLQAVALGELRGYLIEKAEVLPVGQTRIGVL